MDVHVSVSGHSPMCIRDSAITGIVGISLLAARADHVHSAANLLMDGGNY